MRPAEIWRRLRFWRRRDDLGRELSEELQNHLELLARDYQHAGMSRDAAYTAARRQLGNIGRIREASRDSWGFPALDALLQDLRYTFRGLRKSPGFTTVVIVTLGLGIGANAAMFGIVDRLMFRPYPFLHAPSRVHRVYLRSTDRDNRETTNSSFEYARYLDLQRWTSSFSQYAAFANRRLAVGSGDATRERRVAVVGAAFFDFFDARPALGRYFAAAEDTTPRGAEVVVLSYDFWQKEFGGRNVLGQTLQVSNILCTIIGVAPRGFVGVEDDDPAAVYLPITTFAGSQSSRRQATTYFTNYNWGWMEMMVRRKPGVTLTQASSDLSNAYLRSWNAERALSASLTPAEIAKPNSLAGALKESAGPDPSLEARTALWVTGVALIVLLIACANVANLYLARALRRQRETAVRIAIGVSRRRLLGQYLAEGLVLALLGSVAGLLIASWGGAAVRRFFVGGTLPFEVFGDWRTVAVTTLLALAVGLLTGIAPALLGLRGDVASSLKAGVREGTRHRSRVRTGLLVAQGTLSVALLVGAGLFVRSLQHVKNLRLGFDAEPVLLAEPNLRGMRLGEAEEIALGRRVLAAGQAIPGVEHAAWVGAIPFYSTSGTGLHVTGIDSVQRLGRFSYEVATPDYFATMGTRIVRGRPFTAADRAGTERVAVVSESMARVLWPGREALGQCMRVGADTMPCTAVIGIAEDAFQRSLIDDQRFHYYLPLEQFRENEGFALLLRMRGDPAPQMETIRRELQKLMPGQAYVTVRPLLRLVDGQRRSWQFGATMFVAFGLLALVVAAVGLYGVIAYDVAQRMHELGVRIALGAQSGDVIRLVVGQGLRFALVGILLGGALAVLAGKWIQPLLFQQSARDPWVFGAVASVLLIVALLASGFPARKAAHADPNSALRAD
jgi:putative ABC transport system permease protein